MGGINIFNMYISYRMIIVVVTAIAATIEVVAAIWRTSHKKKKRKKKKKKTNQQLQLPPGPDYMQKMIAMHQDNAKALPADDRIEIKFPKSRKPKEQLRRS